MPEAALVDTSVAVPAVLAAHEHHATARASLRSVDPGLAGHAWFETYAVLTRLPGPLRLSPHQARDVLAHDFPTTRWLTADDQRALAEALAAARLRGGATYDALVGWTARCHDLALLTRDTRALPTYAALGVRVRLVG